LPDDGGQEKLHDPTEERLREAAREGNVACSREVVAAAALAAALGCIFIRHGAIGAAMGECARDFFTFSRHLSIDESSVLSLFYKALFYFVKAAAPVVIAGMAGGILANAIQTRFNWASRKNFFDLSKLDPVKGLRNIFSAAKAFDGLISLVKFGVFALVFYLMIRGELERMLALGAMTPDAALEAVISIAMIIAWRAMLLLIVLAIADYAFQRFTHRKSLRMSHQELLEEMRENEGDPAIRQYMRRRQRQISASRTAARARNARVG
jgi:flagellar biosynthesis protein FlhB